MHKDLTPFSIVVNGEEVKQGEVSQANADLLQLSGLPAAPQSALCHTCTI
jgi:hypothetical protein